MEETNEGVYFPRVGTSLKQKQFLNRVLLPGLEGLGLIERAKFSDFVRWAIERAAQDLEIGVEPPKITRGTPGPKKMSR